MTLEDANTSVRFSDATLSLTLGRAIAEGLSDIVRQPLPPAVVDLLNELDRTPGREPARRADAAARPAGEHDT